MPQKAPCCQLFRALQPAAQTVVCHQLTAAAQSHWDWKSPPRSPSPATNPALPSSPRTCFPPSSSHILCVHKVTRVKVTSLWSISQTLCWSATDYPNLCPVLYAPDQDHLFHSQGWASAVIHPLAAEFSSHRPRLEADTPARLLLAQQIGSFI